MLELLEELNTFTPLGIRFWDPVLNTQIRDSLRVTARSERGRGRAVCAFRTASDIYAFNGLPGLRTVENSSFDPQQNASPTIAHEYIIEVEDTRRNFNKVAFRVDLPLKYRGVFLSRTDSSPPQNSPRFILYSAPTRTAPSWLAVIRGELVDFETGQPAAHAVLKVHAPDERIWYGLADEMGRFGVFMTYPTIEGIFVGSPRMFIGKPLNEQNWDLVVEVLYAPNTLEGLPHTELPNYLSILRQKPARIWQESPGEGSPGGAGSDVSELAVTLEFGKELILRTDGKSKLAISPTESSP
jgi:hypothetical protein